MELLKISNTKMKITLSKEDIDTYRLPADADYENADSRAAFRQILDDAEEKTGFSTRDRVLLRYYPARQGGGEIFVTRIEEAATQQKTVSELWSFASLPDLLRAARCLSPMSADLYAFDGAYYLAFSLPATPYGRLSPTAFLADFGRERTANLLPYISEHGRCLRKNDAIELLSKI